MESEIDIFTIDKCIVIRKIKAILDSMKYMHRISTCALNPLGSTNDLKNALSKSPEQLYEKLNSPDFKSFKELILRNLYNL